MGLFNESDDVRSALVIASVNNTLGPDILKEMEQDGSHFIVNPDFSVRFFINTPELSEKIDKAFAVAVEKAKELDKENG